jgi:tripartite-type tricarboxylate transporter receptor subunit TctC
VIDRLGADLAKAMTSADLREKFDGMGVEALSGTPDALREFARAEADKWGKLIREAGIRAD